MDNCGSLPEVADVVLCLDPVNLATAANNGRWVNVANMTAMNFIVIAGAGGSGENPVINLQQAKDSSGTGAKTLQLRRVDYKVGATAIAAAQDLWTRVSTITRDAPADSWDTTGIGGGANAINVSIYVLPQDLDINNGFSYVRVQIPDSGSTAKLGTIIAVPIDKAYKGKQNASLLS